MSPHRHDHNHRHGGGQFTRPRRYELVGTVGFLGLRPLIYGGLVRLSGAAPGERVLDVGCGTGYFSRRAARALGETGRVVGIDPSPQMIEYAHRHSPPNCDYHVAGGEQIPAADGSFDLVISSLAVHHIPPESRATAVAEMFRVLRPGGRLLIADFPGMAERVRDLVRGAGFTITGSGHRRPFLSYLQATRP